jgi:hypothetical protein
MNRSNMAKIVAAFVAGVVFTMGSLTYLRNHELSHFRKPAAKSLTPERFTTSGSGSPTQEPSKLSEGVTPSSTSVPNVEAPLNERVSPQVPEPTVPKAARVQRVRNRHSETAQNAVPGGAPNAATEDPASASAGSGDAWHTLPQTNSVTVPGLSSGAGRMPEQRPKLVTLEPGTRISIRVEENISTDRNRSGDVFRGSLDSPLIVNGFVLAEKGARVLGEVEKSKRARLLGSRADLSLRLTEISMADGQRVAIQTSRWEEKGAHGSVADTPKMAAGAALGAVVGALTGAARGAGFVSDDAGARKNRPPAANKRNLVLTTGAQLTFRVVAPVTITETVAPR